MLWGNMSGGCLLGEALRRWLSCCCGEYMGGLCGGLYGFPVLARFPVALLALLVVGLGGPAAVWWWGKLGAGKWAKPCGLACSALVPVYSAP